MFFCLFCRYNVTELQYRFTCSCYKIEIMLSDVSLTDIINNNSLLNAQQLYFPQFPFVRISEWNEWIFIKNVINFIDIIAICTCPFFSLVSSYHIIIYYTHYISYAMDWIDLNGHSTTHSLQCSQMLSVVAHHPQCRPY